jgi:flagellar biosynthesis/type III secretory pathway protein FliH
MLCAPEMPLTAEGQGPAEDLERARELLAEALDATREGIGGVARQFERLAAEAGEVLDRTAAIVACVEGECGGFMVPLTERLGAAAREFLSERIASLSVVADVFVREGAMLEKLGTLTRDQGRIAREGKALAVLAAMEVARLGATGEGFEYMARELNEFSQMVTLGAAEVRRQTEERSAGLEARRRGLDRSVERMRGNFRRVESELGEAIREMHGAVEELGRIPQGFRDCVAAIAERISRVVAAVQAEDITRQQTEHVREALERVDFGLEAGKDRSSAGRRAALLRVQAAQMRSVERTTEDWIAQIDECLEGILQVSSSEVVAIAATILRQEQALAGQLGRVEELERESEADHAGIEQFLEGLNGLSRLVRAHLERSRDARERMQLLNFNSMIEARRLGSRAAAVLEVARNISRISSDWGELTDRSGAAMEEMLEASSLAEEANRRVARATMENLERARAEGHGGIEALKQAAATAQENGARVEAAVGRLHREIDAAGGMAARLQDSLGLIGRAVELVEAGAGCAPGPAAVELGELEREWSAQYTSEVERQVLRAALYGEAMPEAQTAVTGNDVELF